MLHLLLALVAWLFVSPAYAEEDPGILRVTSNARDARVVLDYTEDVGTTPVTRYLPAGTYTVRVVADGYDPHVQRVTIVSGQAVDLNTTLIRGGSTVEFLVKPGGAAIEIDGKDTGLTSPARLPKMQAGTYTYRLTRDGYEPLEGEFELNKGGNVLVAEQMLSSSGLFEIATRPEGVTVYLDGEEVGVTPLKLDGIEPGEHRVGLVKDGYALLVREVDTRDGSKGVVDAKLKSGGAAVTVKTGSPSGTASLDGVPLGTGATLKTEATRGGYDLVVSAEGAEPVSQRVTIPASGGIVFKADLAAAGGTSTITELAPLTRRPIFWIAAGGGLALVGGGTGLAIALTRPEPDPEGDVVLTLP
jgi:hypothetical protein